MSTVNLSVHDMERSKILDLEKGISGLTQWYDKERNSFYMTARLTLGGLRIDLYSKDYPNKIWAPEAQYKETANEHL